MENQNLVKKNKRITEVTEMKPHDAVCSQVKQMQKGAIKPLSACMTTTN